MSEAASQHINNLQHHAVPSITSQPPIKRRPPTNISYTKQSFPSLPKVNRSQESYSSIAKNLSSKSTTQTEVAHRDKQRLEEMEKKIQQQQEQLEHIQLQLTEQQTSIHRLTKVIEDQQQITVTLQQAISQLTTTVNNMEQIMTQLLQFQRKDPPSPDPVQPIKRSRLRQDASSPDTAKVVDIDEPMGDHENWESPPNMPSSHSPDAAKRL